MERTILLELEQYKVMLDEELITHDQYNALEKSLLSLEISHRLMGSVSEECLSSVKNDMVLTADPSVETRVKHHQKSMFNFENIMCMFSVVFAVIAIFLVPVFFGTMGMILGVLVRDKMQSIGNALIILNVGMTMLGMGVGTLSVW